MSAERGAPWYFSSSAVLVAFFLLLPLWAVLILLDGRRPRWLKWLAAALGFASLLWVIGLARQLDAEIANGMEWGLLWGLALGSAPMLVGALRDRLSIGFAGFVACALAGTFTGLVGAVPLAGLFVWLTAHRHPLATGDR